MTSLSNPELQSATGHPISDGSVNLGVLDLPFLLVFGKIEEVKCLNRRPSGVHPASAADAAADAEPDAGWAPPAVMSTRFFTKTIENIRIVARATRNSQEVTERIRKGRRLQEDAGEYKSARRNHEQPGGARRAVAPQVTRRRHDNTGPQAHRPTGLQIQRRPRVPAR